MRGLPMAAAVVLAALSFNGCLLVLGAGAGAGGYSYVQGELTRSYSAGLDSAWHASQKALSSLSLKVVERQKDGLGGRIDAQRADGTKVVLKFDAREKGSVAIGIRVGTFGNRKASEKIHGKIAAFLKP